MEINSIKTDPNLALDGVWIDFEDDARVKIAANGNPAHQRALAKHAKKFGNRLKRDPLAGRELAAEAMADAIVLDWEGFTENGEPLPCTRENKIKLLNIPAFADWAASQCQDIANFQKEATAEDAETLKSQPDVAS